MKPRAPAGIRTQTMFTATATRMEDTAFATGIAHARADVVVGSNPSMGWRRVGSLAIGGAPEPQILTLNSDDAYRFVKLRATLTDVYIPHFTLEFGGGSLQGFSVGCLLRVRESRPVDLAGREWKGILLEYLVRAGERGEIEVWAMTAEKTQR